MFPRWESDRNYAVPCEKAGAPPPPQTIVRVRRSLSWRGRLASWFSRAVTVCSWRIRTVLTPVAGRLRSHRIHRWSHRWIYGHQVAESAGTHVQDLVLYIKQHCARILSQQVNETSCGFIKQTLNNVRAPRSKKWNFKANVYKISGQFPDIFVGFTRVKTQKMHVFSVLVNVIHWSRLVLQS